MNACCTPRQVFISRQRQHGPGHPGAQRCLGAARCTGSKLQPGEIVAYRSGSSVVIHRLVENHIVEGELVTKGDANAEPDPLKVEYASVLGTVTAHIPFIGIYAGALNTLPGKMYAFGFIVAVAMLYLLAHELSE